MQMLNILHFVQLMTEDNNLRNTDEFKEFGCDDYMTKSFGPLMIKEIVYNITKKCNQYFMRKLLL